jgi:hypothetical protein
VPETDTVAKRTRANTTEPVPAETNRPGRPAPASDPGETPGVRLARLTAAWAVAFESLVAARIGFLALCDEPSAYGDPRDGAEQAWREAEQVESAAAAAALGVWTGGSGDADVVADESEVEVDPAAALTFWKRADWDGYCGWATGCLARPRG